MGLLRGLDPVLHLVLRRENEKYARVPGFEIMLPLSLSITKPDSSSFYRDIILTDNWRVTSRGLA
jgi:hypothetical protein